MNNTFDLNKYCEEQFRRQLTEKIFSEDGLEKSKLNQWISIGKKIDIEEDDENQDHEFTEKITFVFRNKIKKHIVLFTEEIDCFERMNQIDNDQFGIVKFKLSRKPQQHEQRNDYFMNVRKFRWWSQCVLCSVKKLVSDLNLI